MEYLLLLGKELQYGEEIRFVYILKHSKKEIKKVMSKDGDHLYLNKRLDLDLFSWLRHHYQGNNFFQR